MSCDVGKATEGLDNELCLRQNYSVGSFTCSEGCTLGQNTLMMMMMMMMMKMMMCLAAILKLW